VSFTPPISVGVGQPITFTANVANDWAAMEAVLHFRKGGDPVMHTLPMDPVRDGAYTIVLPGPNVTESGVHYYITVGDHSYLTVEPPDSAGFIPVDFALALAVTDTQRYYLMGIPGTVSATMAAILEDDLGAYDTSQWRLGRWDPVAESYDEYPNLPNFAPGRGYWFITRDQVTVDAAVASANAATGISVTLEPGWNMIAHPYVFDVDWDDVDKQVGITDDVWGYEYVAVDSLGYTHPTTLQQGIGYWVHNAAAGARTLHIPGTVSVKKKASAAPRFAGDEEWFLELRAGRGRHIDAGNLAAVSPQAAVGIDALDRPEPPTLPGGLSLGFALDDGERGHLLETDARAPLAGGGAWDLVLRGDPGGDPVRLSVHGLADLPAGMTASLLRAGGYGGVDLAETNEAEFRLPADGEMRLTLLVGDPSFVANGAHGLDDPPAAFRLAAGFPNPFNPQTTLGFDLPSPARARLRVFDARGRLVRSLLDAELPAGRHWTEWDGRDDAGHELGSGVYFARLEAGAEKATNKLVLLR